MLEPGGLGEPASISNGVSSTIKLYWPPSFRLIAVLLLILPEMSTIKYPPAFVDWRMLILEISVERISAVRIASMGRETPEGSCSVTNRIGGTMKATCSSVNRKYMISCRSEMKGKLPDPSKRGAQSIFEIGAGGQVTCFSSESKPQAPRPVTAPETSTVPVYLTKSLLVGKSWHRGTILPNAVRLARNLWIGYTLLI